VVNKKYPVEETENWDDCECVYCGNMFNGRNATNANMDCQSVICPKCGKQMYVGISVRYMCTPIEE
jgi:NAD-dependent SIR2 family protein deacetylase